MGLPDKDLGTIEERREADEEAIENLAKTIRVKDLEPKEVSRIGRINYTCTRPNLIANVYDKLFASAREPQAMTSVLNIFLALVN